MAANIQGRIMANQDVGVQAMNLLRQCLGQMGATPSDASKITVLDDEDEKDDSSIEVALARVSAYAQAVLDGVEVAGPHVRNACRRHFADLERDHERGLYWDDEAANRVFRFFEERLRLSEGQFDGKASRRSAN